MSNETVTTELGFTTQVQTKQIQPQWGWPGYYKGKPRPTIKDKDLISMAIDEELKGFMAYNTESGEEAAKEVKEQLTATLNYTYADHDGFKLAKALDDEGWEGSSELVELCDELIHRRSQMARQAETLWVGDNELKQQYPDGMLVTYKAPWGKSTTGTVVGWDADGRYRIKPSQLAYTYLVPLEQVVGPAEDKPTTEIAHLASE